VDDPDAERLSTLLTSLPALRSIRADGICALILRPLPGAPVAAAQDFLALAARTIGRCSCLQDLDLVIDLADKQAEPGASDVLAVPGQSARARGP